MIPRSSVRRSRSDWRLCERGVEAVELAIVLPVFIGLFFAFVDLARIISGYSSVRTAAALGARHAAATGRKEWKVIPLIMNDGAGLPEEKRAVTSAPVATYEEFVRGGDSGWYAAKAAAQNITNSELYRVEYRAIAYANYIMFQSVGNAEYPCDTAGCYNCFTLRGDEENFQKYFSLAAGGGNRTWKARMLGLQCVYNVPVTTALVGLGWLPEFVTVTGRAYVSMENYAGVSYDPDS